ncbi:MAG: hypothetical protein HY613_11100, partial [Candidatus Rokubacteria bacterium]|nr:hypothetical protein [Candidatus Rokubacteria bacterium]
MGRQFRKLDQLMLSVGDKEASYNAGPGGWLAASAIQLFEFSEAYAVWDDKLRSDRDSVHGSQFATTDEIVRQDVRLAYTERQVRPAHLGGLLALAGGVVATVQDGALVAYRHKFTPVAADVALPSIAMMEKASGEQFLCKGIKLDSLALARGGSENAYWSLEAGLIGSGHRASDATAFVTKLTEAPLRWGDAKCWLETGTDISIDAAPTQGLENISSGTPDVLTLRLKGARFSVGNALQADEGYEPASGKVRGRLDHGDDRRFRIELTVEVDPSTLATERGYYDNRDNVAVELEVDSGTIIAATGVYKYGFDLIIPRLRLEPIARSVDRGVALVTFAGECMYDGTNPLWNGYEYTAYA